MAAVPRAAPAASAVPARRWAALAAVPLALGLPALWCRGVDWGRFGEVLARAGSPGLVLPAAGALQLLVGLGVASALPSTPGAVGIWQMVAVLVLPAFGLDRGDPLAYRVLLPASGLLVAAFWGGLGMWRLGAWR